MSKIANFAHHLSKNKGAIFYRDSDVSYKKIFLLEASYSTLDIV
jgi:hypothetical protein